MRKARAIALSLTVDVSLEAARITVVYGCALALIWAGLRV
jgi:hypothetical protein